MHQVFPTLHRSNQAEQLGRAFIEMIRRDPLENVFQPETVLVGSTGLRDWLRRRVAEEAGIAAQLSFVYPGVIASWLHQAAAMTPSGGDADPQSTPHDLGHVPDSEEETPWVQDRLVWVVASELVVLRAQAEGAGTAAHRDPLVRYLLEISTPDEAPGTLSAPLFALAAEISRLFLRYHAWRPEMVAAWASKKDCYTCRNGSPAPFEGAAADLAWQPDLWRRVRARLAKGGALDPIAELGIDPAAWPAAGSLSAAATTPHEELTSALRAVLPPRISLFGVSALAPLQLLALARIAQAVPVHWFLTAPTPFWLGDQTLSALTGQDVRQRAFLNASNASNVAEQRNIYLLEPRRKAERPTSAGEPGGIEHRSFDELEGTVCPLVAAFGSMPRAGQLLIEEILPNAPEGATDFVHPLWSETKPAEGQLPSLLRRLQADVYMLEAAAYTPEGAAGTPFRHDIEGRDDLVSLRGERCIAPGDRSLGFHACYGPSRQVDAVRDLIVDALAEDETLRPGDIAVMTPDIATYAPLIEATFLPHAPKSESLKRTGIPGIPIRIQDRAIRSTNPVAGVLLALLSLAEGRRTMSEVIGLLGLEPVHTHFGLQQDDVTRVEKWLRAAGARWGLDATDLEQDTSNTGRPDSRLRHTLLAALDRLALGAVMPLEVQSAPEGASFAGVSQAEGLPVFPLDEAGDRTLATRAVHFLETLIGALNDLRAPRSLAEWLNLFADEDARHPGLLQRFVTLPPSRAWQKAQVMDELEALARDTDALGLGESDNTHVLVAPAAIAAWMRSRMDRADRSVSDGLDAVTFCSLMPVRSVPYRWIILLGVDQEVFPRAGTRPAWDIIAREARPWDRNPRDEDRALFLDALLSARTACHIVYTGRTPQRNEEVAPAAPIAQLMEMLDRRFDAPTPQQTRATSASAWLTRHYPLQPFSERNFRKEGAEREGWRAPRPRVYHKGERSAAESLRSGRRSAASWALDVPWHDEARLPASMTEKTPLVLTLKELASFYEDPLASWLKRVAGLTWPKREESAPDDLFPVVTNVLDRLDTMKTASRHQMVWNDSLASAFALLPIGGPGRIEGRALLDKVSRLNAALFDGERGCFQPPETRRVEVLLALEGIPGVEGTFPIRLQGEVQTARWLRTPGHVVLSTQYSTVRAKHATLAWLELLLSMAAGPGREGDTALPTGVVVGVASHKPDGDISAHGVDLATLGCPAGEALARDWARCWLQERVRTWLVGHARPMPVLPSGSREVVEKGYGAYAENGSPSHRLQSWLAAILNSAPQWEPLPAAHEGSTEGPWCRAFDAMDAALRGKESGDDDSHVAAALAKLRSEARATWNAGKFIQDNMRFREDTEQSILRRMFGEEGPAQRWPDPFVVESWRVFGPGVALAKAMETNELAASEPFAAWSRGGVE